jgi:hypothetical protein
MRTGKLNRRRLQYSLRSLLLFVLLANAAMAWFFPRLRAARQQREAVAAIRAVGAEITYDYEVGDATRRRAGARASPPTPPGAAWARRLLGDDFFADVVKVGYRSPPFRTGRGPNPITDGCLEQVAKLPRLRVLDLEASGVSDEGLKAVIGLRELRELKLAHTPTTDRGLTYVGKIAQLEALDLDLTRVTDAGLEELAQLRHLRYLRLLCTATTPEGVARLQRAMPGCQILWWTIGSIGPPVDAHPPTASEPRRQRGMDGVGGSPARSLQFPWDAAKRAADGDGSDWVPKAGRSD